MGKILSNLLGLPRHGECKGCAEPIAESSNKSNDRWERAPRAVVGQRAHHNRDGSINVDGTACDDSADGKHHPKPGSLW